MGFELLDFYDFDAEDLDPEGRRQQLVELKHQDQQAQGGDHDDGLARGQPPEMVVLRFRMRFHNAARLIGRKTRGLLTRPQKADLWLYQDVAGGAMNITSKQRVVSRLCQTPGRSAGV